MELEILLSCMYQEDMSIIEKSRITGDVLIINQTDEEKEVSGKTEHGTARMICTRERGLSRSRNMALRHAKGDICLLCDDDEVFLPGYEKTILQAFERYPEADVIAFNLTNRKPRLRQTPQKIGYLRSLRLASYHLAFRRDRILQSGLRFDERMGAGTGNGGGEENKFLLDCLREKLRIRYEPEAIAEMREGSSTWFFGFDEAFFYQRGASTRYMMGFWPAAVYGLYYILAKYPRYRSTISPGKAGSALFRGMKDDPLGK